MWRSLFTERLVDFLSFELEVGVEKVAGLVVKQVVVVLVVVVQNDAVQPSSVDWVTLSVLF